MPPSSRLRPVALAALALAGAPALARAQSADATMPPPPSHHRHHARHAPADPVYAAPAYGPREPDADELAFGNGQLHSSGQWRHWGDSRNQGEFFLSLIAPGSARSQRGRMENGLPAGDACTGFGDC